MTDDNPIRFQLSEGTVWFPSADGTEMVEVGGTDRHGQPAPAEQFYSAEFLRRLTEPGEPR